MLHKTDHNVIVYIETPDMTASGHKAGKMRHVPWSHTDNAEQALLMADEAQRYADTDMADGSRVVFDGNVSDRGLCAYRRAQRAPSH